MRTILWILLAIALMAAYIVFHRQAISESAVPPGQYPLQETAFWPAVQAVGLYRPRSKMGDDTLFGKEETSAKLACVMNASNWVIQ